MGAAVPRDRCQVAHSLWGSSSLSQVPVTVGLGEKQAHEYFADFRGAARVSLMCLCCQQPLRAAGVLMGLFAFDHLGDQMGHGQGTARGLWECSVFVSSSICLSSQREQPLLRMYSDP